MYNKEETSSGQNLKYFTKRREGQKSEGENDQVERRGGGGGGGTARNQDK